MSSHERSTPTLSEIITKIRDDGDESNYYVFQPHYQRDYVWRQLQAQKFIDTILDNQPFPEVEFSYYTENPRCIEVFNGAQRLRTCKAFLTGEKITNKDKQSFYITDSNGRKYTDLSNEEKGIFRNVKVSCVTHARTSADLGDALLARFIRINSGTTNMLPQDKFSALFAQKSTFKILRNLAKSEDWSNFNFFKSGRMNRNKEMTLYAIFALYYGYIIKGQVQRASEDFFKNEIISQEQIMERYNFLIRLIKKIELEKIVEEKWHNQEGRPSYLPIVFTLSLLMQQPWAQIDTRLGKIIPILEEIFSLNQGQMQDASGTLNLNKNHQAVFSYFKNKLISIFSPCDEKRYFTDQDKEEFFTKNKNCSKCAQVILNIKNASADHIEPWIQGGPTILKNMQLMHSTCNSQKNST